MLCYYPLVLSIRSPHLADDRGYNDHDSADDPGHAQRFFDKQCGKQQRGNRVNIAQNRDGLRFQPVHAPEIQQIKDACMHDAHDQDQKDRRRRKNAIDKAVCQQQIRDHHDTRRQELNGCFLIDVNAAELLIHQHDCGVENRGDESEQRSPEITAGAAAKDSGNQNHADNRNCGADCFPRSQLFFEKQRCRQKHDRRLHVITQRCDGDSRVVECLKQQYPVQSKHCAGCRKKKTVLTGRRTCSLR